MSFKGGGNFYPPPKSKGSSLRVKNWKNYRNVDLDSSKEGFWCTECNATNLSSLRSIISEKINKNRLKMVIFYHFANFLPFGVGFSWFLHKWYFAELRFFVLHSVGQNPSFKLSKSLFRQFLRLFTLRGDPFDLGGGGKIYHHRKEKSYRGPR